MASAVARFPLRDTKRVQHLALTYRPPREPDQVPIQNSMLMLLPQEVLLVVFLQLVAVGSGAAGFTLAALHSLALLSRTCFHLRHSVRALRLPFDAVDGNIKRLDDQWCKVDKSFFKNAKQIELIRNESREGRVVYGTIYIVRDCIEDRFGDDCLEGMLGAPRIFLTLVHRHPLPELYEDEMIPAVELSLSDGLKYFNTSCKESEVPQGNDGSLWGLVLDDEYECSTRYCKTDVYVHSPHKCKRHVQQKWSISIHIESEAIHGLHIRQLEINHSNVGMLQDLFNSQLAPNVARCRYGKGAGSALLPVHVSSGGDVSPQNVMDDGQRRSSAARADRVAKKVSNQLISLTRSGRILPDGALAHEFETIEDAQNKGGYVDDQIARGDEEEEESDEEDSEYVEGHTDDDEDDDEDEGGEESDSEASSNDAESSSEE